MRRLHANALSSQTRGLKLQGPVSASQNALSLTGRSKLQRIKEIGLAVLLGLSLFGLTYLTSTAVTPAEAAIEEPCFG